MRESVRERKRERESPIKFYLKVFRNFLLKDQREVNLSKILYKIILDSDIKSKFNIADYGSGFQPTVIKLINKNLIKKKIKVNFDCYDFYSHKELRKLNSNTIGNIKFKYLKNFQTKKYYITIVSDVLHHIGVDKNKLICKILLKIKKNSEFVIIKDHFEYSYISRLILRFMDFIGNYYNSVSIPERYYNEKDFNNLLKKLEFKIVKKIIGVQIYSKKFLFFSNPKLHFIYILK